MVRDRLTLHRSIHPHLSPRERWIVATSLLAILLVLIAIMTWVYPTRPLSYDEVRYIEMATGHISVEYPYSYRVLVPWLVSILPLSHTYGFLCVTLASLYLTALCIYFSLRGYSLAPGLSFAGVVLFVTSYASMFNLYHFRLVDACSLLWIALSLFFIQRERDLWLAIALAIGGLCKESVLFVIPVYLLAASRRANPNAIRMTCTVLPVLALFFTAHTLHWFGAHTSNYTGRQVDAVFAYQIANYGSVWLSLTVALVAAFGTFWIAAAVGFRRAPAQLRILSTFLIFVALQLVLGGDWIRMLSVGIPVLIPLTMFFLRTARPLPLTLFAAADVVLYGLLLYPQHMLLLYFPFHVCLVTLCLVLALRPRQTSVL